MVPGSYLRASNIIDTTTTTSMIKEGLTWDPLAILLVTSVQDGTIPQGSTFSKSPEGFLMHLRKHFVPDFEDLHLLILQMSHGHHVAGHPGVRKTL